MVAGPAILTPCARTTTLEGGHDHSLSAAGTPHCCSIRGAAKWTRRCLNLMAQEFTDERKRK